MTLSRFIDDHLEDILAAWEILDPDLMPAPPAALRPREHARLVLQAVARDLDAVAGSFTPCTRTLAQCMDVSITAAAAPQCAGCTQGKLRQLGGYTLPQLTGEFRDLRTAVLCLWLPQLAQLTPAASREMLGFNRSLDDALGDAVAAFSFQTLRRRDLFLAMLGHDLRSPLAAMSLAGQFLARPEVGTDPTRQFGARIRRSAASMTAMVTDLLQCARTELGSAIPIMPQRGDMREICLSALEEAGAAHPGCEFELAASGDLIDDFDGPRLRQVLSNLLNNAAQYRAHDQPVKVIAEGNGDAIVVRVRNRGPVIPADSLRAIFDPLVQLPIDGQQHARPATSMGLGLFIASQITLAHGGTIKADSDASTGTVFTVRLPRARAGLAAASVH